jgi:hypothetical protein
MTLGWLSLALLAIGVALGYWLGTRKRTAGFSFGYWLGSRMSLDPEDDKLTQPYGVPHYMSDEWRAYRMGKAPSRTSTQETSP